MHLSPLLATGGTNDAPPSTEKLEQLDRVLGFVPPVTTSCSLVFVKPLCVASVIENVVPSPRATGNVTAVEFAWAVTVVGGFGGLAGTPGPVSVKTQFPEVV